MSTKTDAVLLAINNIGVATVTLNRPETHNAFNPEMIRGLTDAFELIQRDESVRVVILNANGKSFSAGADINWMKEMASYTEEQNLIDARHLARMFSSLYFLNKPTIAKIQGEAFGGGVGLIACCDMAIGSRLSKFCLSEVKLGLIPATISPYVIKSIGAKLSKRYFLTAEVFSSRRARRIGLLSESVSEVELDECVNNLVNSILKNGPTATQQAKALINHVDDSEISEELMEHTSKLIAQIRVSEEGQEGLKAFLEKRPANWPK